MMLMSMLMIMKYAPMVQQGRWRLPAGCKLQTGKPRIR